MPYRITEFQPTPNPNAIKCVLDRPVAAAPRSYRTKPEGPMEGDPVAAALFAVPGVVGLLLNADWVTVSKAAEADWKGIKAGVKKALEEGV